MPGIGEMLIQRIPRMLKSTCIQLISKTCGELEENQANMMVIAFTGCQKKLMVTDGDGSLHLAQEKEVTFVNSIIDECKLRN